MLEKKTYAKVVKSLFLSKNLDYGIPIWDHIRRFMQYSKLSKINSILIAFVNFFDRADFIHYDFSVDLLFGGKGVKIQIFLRYEYLYSTWKNLLMMCRYFDLSTSPIQRVKLLF